MSCVSSKSSSQVHVRWERDKCRQRPSTIAGEDRIAGKMGHGLPYPSGLLMGSMVLIYVVFIVFIVPYTWSVSIPSLSRVITTTSWLGRCPCSSVVYLHYAFMLQISNHCWSWLDNWCDTPGPAMFHPAEATEIVRYLVDEILEASNESFFKQLLVGILNVVQVPHPEAVRVLHQCHILWLSKPHNLLTYFTDHFIGSVNLQKIVHRVKTFCEVSFILARTEWLHFEHSTWCEGGSSFLFHKQLKEPYGCSFVDAVRDASQLEQGKESHDWIVIKKILRCWFSSVIRGLYPKRWHSRYIGRRTDTNYWPSSMGKSLNPLCNYPLLIKRLYFLVFLATLKSSPVNRLIRLRSKMTYVDYVPVTLGVSPSVCFTHQHYLVWLTRLFASDLLFAVVNSVVGLACLTTMFALLTRGFRIRTSLRFLHMAGF